MFYVHIFASIRYTDSGSLSTLISPVLPYITSFVWYYILCIFITSPQAVVNVKFKMFSANSHIKVQVLCGAMWLPHIYISRLYKILVIFFVVINDYQCVAHCGPSIDRQFYIPLLL